MTLDLLAYETGNRNALTAALERVREERSKELFAAMARAEIPFEHGMADIGVLFAAAINYLTVRGRELSIFGGLGVKTDADWARIEALVRTDFDAVQRLPAPKT